MHKYSMQTVRLNREIVDESKEFIKALGLPVIQAPSEADAQMAFMNEKGDVWACGTSDIDPLLYGAPRIITNLTLSQRKKVRGIYVKINPEIVELSEVLNSLGVSHDQLIALSILVGTDYNSGGVKGVGAKTALKLVKSENSFDKLFKDADFNWKQVYAIFKSMSIMKNYQLKWKSIDADKVKKILVDEHDFSEERVDNTLGKNFSEGQKGLLEF